ncbi:hypothetical protein LTR78_010464 [Recurvomyces mirabilis]|uniref:Uncharacterized protein n=1 Tax=Recurvomyces mirabilis TaxID=574656 RepID=A0AAE0TMG5_9PEZI|nr:hypothetical protein LTR78_010464 [Recurvomyces mirabilis]KAK5150357.1 hypothetical protein LTS14_010196 [Recurvomyces mirabilis]
MAQRAVHGEGLGSFFLCNAMINITQMDFEPGVRDFDEANVVRLLGIFKQEGCQRHDSATYVPAILVSGGLSRLQHDGEALQDLRTQSPAFTVKCLHGKHRVLAAKRFLPSHDQWWPVTLYTPDMPDILQQAIVEEYRNELTFSDGDIFRSYRIAKDKGDRKSEEKWLARLSAVKKRNILQLQKVDNGDLINGFDRLLPFLGMWQHFLIGALSGALPTHMWQVIPTLSMAGDDKEADVWDVRR